MKPNSAFEITRRNMASVNVSAILSFAALRGTALAFSLTDDTAFKLADDGVNFAGFLTRDVISGGLTTSERVQGMRISDTPVALESPFKVGGEVSVELAEEIEVEGASYILTSGTGDASAAVVGSKISFRNGKACLAQSGDVVRGVVAAKWTAAADLYDDANNSLRLRIAMV